MELIDDIVLEVLDLVEEIRFISELLDFVRIFSKEEIVEQHSERPDVGLQVASLTGEHLGRHVIGVAIC